MCGHVSTKTLFCPRVRQKIALEKRGKNNRGRGGYQNHRGRGRYRGNYNNTNNNNMMYGTRNNRPNNNTQ